MEKAKMLTTAEVAVLAGVSGSRVRALCAEGRFPGAERVGPPLRGLWMIPADDVERWLEQDRDRRLKGAGERWLEARAKAADDVE